MKKINSLMTIAVTAFILLLIMSFGIKASAEVPLTVTLGNTTYYESENMYEYGGNLFVNNTFIKNVLSAYTKTTVSGNSIVFDNRMKMTAGSNAAQIEDRVIIMPAAPVVFGNQLYVPLKSVLSYIEKDFTVSNDSIAITEKPLSVKIYYKDGSFKIINNIKGLTQYSDVAYSTSHFFIEKFEMEWFSCRLINKIIDNPGAYKSVRYVYEITSPSGKSRRFSLNVTATDQTNIWFEDKELEKQIADITGAYPITIESIRGLTDIAASATSLTGLSYAENLQFLSLTDDGISDFSPVLGLTTLEYFSLDSYGFEAEPFDLKNLSLKAPLKSLSLTTPKILNTARLGSFNALEELVLDSPSLTDLSFLPKLTAIKSLKIFNSENLSNPQLIALATSLENLEFSVDNANIGNISFISTLTRLTELAVENNISKNIQMDFSCNENLHSIMLSGYITNDNIKSVSQALGTASLLIDSSFCSDYSPLCDMPHLDFLMINNQSLNDFSSVADIKSLTQLYIISDSIENLEFLNTYQKLISFAVVSANIKDISSAAHLKNVESLIINCPYVEDFSPISGLVKLRELHLENTKISDKALLSGLLNLQKVYLNQTPISLSENYEKALVAASFETNRDDFFDIKGIIDEKSKTVLFNVPQGVQREYIINAVPASSDTYAVYLPNDTIVLTTAEGLTETYRVIVAEESYIKAISTDLDNDGIFETDAKVLSFDNKIILDTEKDLKNLTEKQISIELGSGNVKADIVKNSDTNKIYINITSENKTVKTYELDNLSALWGGDKTIIGNRNHWAFETYKSLVEEGIIENSEEFDLDKSITRLEFTELFIKIFGLESTLIDGVALPFADIKSIPKTKIPYVLAAYSLGIIKGSDENGNLNFVPQGSITRSQAVAVIYRFLNESDAALNSLSSGYTDFDKVPDYAKNAFEFCLGRGLIKGYENSTLRPLKEISRGEAITILKRVKELQ